MITKDWQTQLAMALSDPGLNQFSLIQPLWNDYGVCVRCYSPRFQQHLVAKVILPNANAVHPKGWQTSHSHLRKCRSYDNEIVFYQRYAHTLDEHTPVPEVVFSGVISRGLLLVMSDLVYQGFPATSNTLSVETCKPVLRWLAAFHANFVDIAAANLWERGTYWHLATREDEWQQMAPCELKNQASAVDKYLRALPGQTLVHGDAKVANFCFSDDLQQCAAVDFQYCGHGPGIVDVAYFLGSALTEDLLLNNTESCLDYYFTTLEKHLAKRYPIEYCKTIQTKWRQAYPVACADFYRFLLGWSPKHKKIHRDLINQAREGLRLVEN